MLPANSERAGLPANVGAVVLTLLPMTKSNPTSAGDVVLAFNCLSGLSVGKWMTRLLSLRPAGSKLFSTPSCHDWTSHHFRHA